MSASRNEMIEKFVMVRAPAWIGKLCEFSEEDKS